MRLAGFMSPPACPRRPSLWLGWLGLDLGPQLPGTNPPTGEVFFRSCAPSRLLGREVGGLGIGLPRGILNPRNPLDTPGEGSPAPASQHASRGWLQNQPLAPILNQNQEANTQGLVKSSEGSNFQSDSKDGSGDNSQSSVEILDNGGNI